MHRKYTMATWAVAGALVLTVLIIGWVAKDKALAMPAFADVPARILPAAPPDLPAVTLPDKAEQPSPRTMEPAPEKPAATEDGSVAASQQEIDAALQRWEQLNEERDRLQQQLVDIYTEQLALANEIWPAQLERLQQFINDQLGAFSTDIDQWIPPALAEFIATKTGKSVTEWEDYILGTAQTNSDIQP